MTSPYDSGEKRPFQDKRAQLARLLKQAATSSLAHNPLSHGQQALWLTHQLAPKSWAYHMVFSAQIRSEVDSPTLQRAFQFLLTRHPVLRTTYTTQSGIPSQHVHPDAPVDFARLHMAAADWANHWDDLLALIQQPFDLERGPVLRVRLLSRSPQEHLLLFVVHHIAIDFWSLGILIQEFQQVYTALRSGIAPSLPSHQTHYTDYIRWQAQMLAGTEGDRLWRYWQHQLNGDFSELNLPTDRPRPPIQTYHGATHAFRLPAPLTHNLHALAHREGATLYMVLLAAIQILLHRYTGQDDISLGSPMAGRNQPQFRSLVGYCVNPVVLRSDLSGDPTSRTFLAHVKTTVLDALRHADYPFSLLVKRLQPSREPSRPPLFQVSMALQTLAHQPELLAFFMPDRPDTTPLQFSDLTLEPFPLPQQEGQVDLTFELAEVGASLCGMLQYNTDLYDATTISRLVHHFEVLLSSIVTNPDTHVSELSLLTANERHQLLVEWNTDPVTPSPTTCLHDLIDLAAREKPEAIALVSGPQQIQYAELNQRANQLAQALQRVGVGPDRCVGLYIDRSIDLIVGILGILKAGGAYVPLDPAHPLDRLTFILSDADISVLVTQDNLRDNLPTDALHTLCLDRDWDRIAYESSTYTRGQVAPDQLAYVMYTSGSTGRPKGVMIEHRQVMTLLRGFEQSAPGHAAPVGTTLCPFGFDVSVWEIFSVLCVGGTLHIMGLDTLTDPSRLTAYLTQHQITNAYLPPGLLPDVVNHLEQSNHANALKRVLVGVEPIPQGLLQRLQATSPDLQIVNGYGPTETTICATLFPFQETTEPDRPAPIGARIPGYELYLLDPSLQPVPLGVPGELYIGGDGVARGYLNRPTLTAERFIANPFSPTPATRLYKTGDLARYRPNRNLDFLGRIDNQVKLHGYRIELGEIEMILRQYPGIRDAALQVREDHPTVKRLVAYIVPHWQPGPTPASLKRTLEAKLPAYMIPSAFVVLDHLPRTANGKIDWRTLPSPTFTQASLSTTGTAPRTPQETALANIWQRVLGLDSISIDDNFFEIGGHSLQAIQLISSLSTDLGLELSVATLFQHPTIATLATAIETHMSPSVPHLPELKSRLSPPRLNRPQCTAPLQPSSAFTVFERRPLLPLLESGELAPVDAVALAYIPNALLDQMGLDREAVLRDWCDHRPSVLSTLEMSLGRIAILALPCLGTDLYQDPSALTTLTDEALEITGRIGARIVSLTGLLPSATDYGRRIASTLSAHPSLPQVSTGHATTTAAVVLTLQQLLDVGGRDLTQERVGILGLGSIGLASLRLMLNCLPHPAELLLCDIYQKRTTLEHVRQLIMAEDQFQGPIHLVESCPGVPSAFYNASLIVGATNMPDVLDINRLRPGTMIVDDSAPHCFSPTEAVQRWQRQSDILFTEGGAVRSQEPIHEVRYLSPAAEQTLTAQQLDAIFVRHHPAEIMGCTLSGLLSARFAPLKPTIGLIDHQTSQQHYATLHQLGFQPAALHCNSYILNPDQQIDFRTQFGNQP